MDNAVSLLDKILSANGISTRVIKLRVIIINFETFRFVRDTKTTKGVSRKGENREPKTIDTKFRDIEPRHEKDAPV